MECFSVYINAFAYNSRFFIKMKKIKKKENKTVLTTSEILKLRQASY